MANNVTVAFRADVADLVTKRAILSAELKIANKDLNDFAKQAKDGLTDELKTKMLASADAVAGYRTQIAALNSDLKSLEGAQRQVANSLSPAEAQERAAAFLTPSGSGKSAIGSASVFASEPITAVEARLRAEEAAAAAAAQEELELERARVRAAQAALREAEATEALARRTAEQTQQARAQAYFETNGLFNSRSGKSAAGSASVFEEAFDAAAIGKATAEQAKFVKGMEQLSETAPIATHQLLNFGYQVNDIIVGLTTGQRPLTVFIQQGAQIAQISAQTGVGLKGMVKGMVDASGAAPLLSAALSPTGLAIGAVGATAIIATVESEKLADEQNRLVTTSLGLGAASGLTAQQIRAAGEAATDSGLSMSQAVAAADEFARAGIKTSASITTLTNQVREYAVLTRQDAAAAQTELATAMQDPVRGAETLNDRLNLLDATQLEQIRSLVAAGDKTQAVAILTQALTQRMDEARAAGVSATIGWDNMSNSLANLGRWLGDVNQRYNLLYSSLQNGHGLWNFTLTSGPLHPDGAQQSPAEVAAALAAQRSAGWRRDSAAALPLINDTPEGRDATRRATLQSNVSLLSKAVDAERQLGGVQSDGYKRAAAALAEYKRAYDTFIPAAEKASKIAALDAQLAEARRKRDSGRVASLSADRARLQAAGEVRSNADVERAAADAGVVGGARTGSPRAARGPSLVSQWTEELQAQQIATNDFFGDQTAAELKFWQGKLALTKAGSKDRLEVQSRIYQAEKTLARDAYADQIADLNDRLQADRDNWAKAKADWDEKLALIKSKFGEESKEYKDAHRQMLADQRQHDQDMERAAQQSREQEFSNLRRHLDALRSLREQAASTDEAVLNDRAQGNPFGEIAAAQALMERHRQLNEQKLADLDTLYAAQTQLLDQSIVDAETRYTKDSAQYKAALDAKAAADQEYQDNRRAAEAQARNESIRDVLAIKQAYQGYISGVVGATTSGFLGMLTRTRTFAQAAGGVYNSLLGVVDQMLQRMVVNWITKHLLMSAAQRAQLAVQVGSHAAAETAKVAASSVGQAGQIAATATGAAAKGQIVAASNLKEITSHAATAAAAAYHAMAGIPVIGPVLGAAAAATTFAAVEAYGVLASFDKGADIIPRDMVAQIHAGERIIPRDTNSKLEQMLKSGGPPGGGNSPFNAHYAPVIQGAGGSTRDIMRELDERGDHFFRWLKQAYRNGKF